MKEIRESKAYAMGEAMLFFAFIVCALGLSLATLGRIVLEPDAKAWMARVLGSIALVTLFWLLVKAVERKS